MPLTCIVVNCRSRADRDRVSFFAVPKISNFKHATHLNELSAQRRQKWISAIKRGDLSDSILKYEKVCSKHFITGKPADLKDVDNIDWVPNQSMGYASGLHLKRKTNLKKLKQVEKNKKIINHNLDNITVQQNLEVDVEHAVQTPTFETGVSVSTQTDLTCSDINNLSDQLMFAQKKMEYFYKDNNQKCYYYTDK